MSEPYWEPLAAAAAVSGAAWATGDYKISAQNASHADPQGGTWYLCDGSATVGSSLIALVGTTLPDARGRDLVMKGTHADVDAIGDNDGAALANRRPKHNTTLSDPGHGHDVRGQNAAIGYGGWVAQANQNSGDNLIPKAQAMYNATTGITAQAAGGSGIADQAAYVVPGNLFVHS